MVNTRRHARYPWFVATIFVIVVLAIFYIPFFNGRVQWIQKILLPIEKVAYLAGVGTQEFIAVHKEREELVLENAYLEQEIEILRKEMIRVADLKRENQELRQQLDIREEQQAWKFIPSRIIGRTPFLNPHVVRIDKGKQDMVQSGDAAVVQGSVLVGRVTDVYETSALVMLLTNEGLAIPATREDSEGAETPIGLVRGTAGFGLQLQHIPLSFVLEEGDSIVSAGVVPEVPYGLRIGTVDEVTHTANDVFQAARVQPDVSYTTLRNLSILHVDTMVSIEDL